MYEIKYNETYGSHEVYFDGKPSEEIRTALKGLKMRWNSVKKCWYGYAKEWELIDAINGGGEAVATDGYLGGGAVYGAKSNKHLYGAALSKAIREELKADGIKGVSVKCKTYSGGQSITVTVSLTQSDMADREQFIDAYRVKGNGWICYKNEEGESICIFYDKYFSAAAEEQNYIRTACAASEYEAAQKGVHLNHYYIDDYSEYSPAFREKLHRINEIISRFHYDESNSMVDYFNTNFYYGIDIKPIAA